MLKALLKKQLSEFLSFLSASGKSGKKAKKKGMTVVVVIALAYAFIGSGVALYFLFDAICAPLCSVGMGWLFFAIVGIMSAGLSVVFGIFTSQPMLYDAKDNDFLLSLPIPASKILFSRMFLLYVQNLFSTLLVFVPSIVCYNRTIDASASPMIIQLLILVVLPFLSLVIECIAGWIVALITSRMRKKTLVTLVLSLAMLGAYVYISSNMSGYITYVIEHAHQLGETIINAFYPFYQMGLGATGEVKGFLIFTAILLAAFAIVYFVLSISFIRIATSKRGAKRVVYTGEALKTRSLSSALFKKELTRFFTTPMYLLNCGLGVIIHLALAVFAVVKKEAVLEIFDNSPIFTNHTIVMAVALVTLVAAMDVITAPSISLEGKNMWILQSMPIDGWQVLKAKLKLHLAVNLPSTILCMLVLGIVMDVGVTGIILGEIFAVIFVVFSAVVGLVCNLRMPEFDWTSAAVVIKQSASTIVTILVGVGSVFTFGGLYYLLNDVMSAEIILAIFIVVIFIVTAVLTYRLKKHGPKRLMCL